MDARQHIIQEAIEEQRWLWGAEKPDQQWILSDWDTWERNPHYSGPEQPHPEDDSQWLTEEDFQCFSTGEPVQKDMQEDDCIPF